MVGQTWDALLSFALNANDDLYVKVVEITPVEHDGMVVPISSPNGMWIASPSAYSSHYVIDISYNGNIGFQSCNASLGFRPVVCLKSNVLLEQQIDGTYVIK